MKVSSFFSGTQSQVWARPYSRLQLLRMTNINPQQWYFDYENQRCRIPSITEVHSTAQRNKTVGQLQYVNNLREIHMWDGIQWSVVSPVALAAWGFANNALIDWMYDIANDTTWDRIWDWHWDYGIDYMNEIAWDRAWEAIWEYNYWNVRDEIWEILSDVQTDMFYDFMWYLSHHLSDQPTGRTWVLEGQRRREIYSKTTAWSSTSVASGSSVNLALSTFAPGASKILGGKLIVPGGVRNTVDFDISGSNIVMRNGGAAINQSLACHAVIEYVKA